MRRLVALGLVLLAASGCAAAGPWTSSGWQPLPGCYENPALLPVADHLSAWEIVRDVVDDYFTIEREEPVRLVGDLLTEGRLDTFAEVGSTLLEPWHHDSASRYEKLHSTLQSIRRQAVVRVIPVEGGYRVDLAVFKELEDVAQPEMANTGAATFRNDSSLLRVVDPVGQREINRGWIPLGRDTALEQRMLGQLLDRSATARL